MIAQRPLLGWTAAFAAGIGLAALGGLPPAAALCLASLGMVALYIRKVPILLPVGLLLLGGSAGAVRFAAFARVPQADISRRVSEARPQTVTGTIASDPEARPGGRWTFFLRADAPDTGEVSVSLGAEAAHGLALDYGDRVRLTGLLTIPEPATNPGGFSWRDFLARRAVYCELKAKHPGAALVLGSGGANPFLKLAWSVRKKALRAIDGSLPPTEAAVLSGILIGRRTDLPPSLLADFVHTGTVHILASAGLHVGILAFWLEKLLGKLSLPRKTQAVLLMAALVLYALVCGGRPAVVRAVPMACLYFGSILFEREPDAPTALGAAALIVLLLQPTALLEPGFQLSFLTVGTLALTMPVWNGFWRPKLAPIKLHPLRRAAEWTLDGLGLSLLAQLGAMPIVALSYSEVSLSSAPANALVVPLLFGLIPLGILGIGVWTVWHGAGALLLSAVGWGITLITGIVRALGESRWAYFSLPPPPLPLVLAFYALVYGGTDGLQRRLSVENHAPPAAAGVGAAGAAGLVGPVPPP